MGRGPARQRRVAGDYPKGLHHFPCSAELCGVQLPPAPESCTGPQAPPQIPRHDIEEPVLEADQVNALANAVPPRYRAMILLAARSGLRAGEIGGLKWGKLDLHGRLTVAEALVEVDGKKSQFTTPKNRSRRVVFLDEVLCEELDGHQRTFTEGGTGPDALVFTTTSDAQMAHSRFTHDVFRPAVRTSLPPEKQALRFDDLRQTCASLMINTGAPPQGHQ